MIQPEKKKHPENLRKIISHPPGAFDSASYSIKILPIKCSLCDNTNNIFELMSHLLVKLADRSTAITSVDGIGDPF